MDFKLDYDFYRKCYIDYNIKDETRLKSKSHFFNLYPDFDVNKYRTNNKDLRCAAHQPGPKYSHWKSNVSGRASGY